jgi:hypothetical protein
VRPWGDFVDEAISLGKSYLSLRPEEEYRLRDAVGGVAWSGLCTEMEVEMG